MRADNQNQLMFSRRMHMHTETKKQLIYVNRPNVPDPD